VCFLLDEMMEKEPERTAKLGHGLAAVSAGLYAAFYPVLIGLQVPVAYTSKFLQWLPSWPI